MRLLFCVFTTVIKLRMSNWSINGNDDDDDDDDSTFSGTHLFIFFSVYVTEKRQCVGASESWIKERHWSSQKIEIIIQSPRLENDLTQGPIPTETKRTIENVSVGWRQSVDRTNGGEGNYERQVIETTGEECGRDAANIGWPVKWTNSCLWALCSKLEVICFHFWAQLYHTVVDRNWRTSDVYNKL